MSSSLRSLQSLTATGRLASTGRVYSSVYAPLKVTALFTTRKAKEERGRTRPQASNDDTPNPPSTSSPLLSVDMFEKQGFRLGAFTKTNELFVGRMAMLGIASSTLGELLTGKGALGQLGLETGLPVFELDWTILAVVGFNLLAALWPVREGDKDARGSGSGGTNQVKENTDGESTSTSTVESNTTNTGISKADFARLFSIKSLASKEREVFVGRVAQIGFAASLLGEGLTGKGILAQFNVETGIAVGDLKIFLAVFVVLTLIASVWDGEEEKGQPTN